MFHAEQCCTGCKGVVTGGALRKGKCGACYVKAWRAKRRAVAWCLECRERDVRVLVVRRLPGRVVTLCANCSTRVGPRPTAEAVARIGSREPEETGSDRRSLRDRRVWSEAVALDRRRSA